MATHGARIGVARRTALGLLVSLLAATPIVGCGSSASSHTPSGRELALQRAQFARLGGELQTIAAAVRREVSAARVAWPLIADGLPRSLPSTLRSAVARASARARVIPEPSFLAHAAQLTGPAAGTAGLYESYARLATQGWRLTETGIAAIVGGAPAVAGFARNNSSLYIDAIYDAHFDLSLLGKSLTNAYEKLGGPQAFGATLPQSELDALAAAYSIPAVRLEPHPARAVAEG